MDTWGLPVTSVRGGDGDDLDRSRWPARLACVRQVLDEGIELGSLTVLVGENGSGKSTLVEAIAQQYGLSPEGGSTGARHSTRVTESPLWQALALHRGRGAAQWGFFLRAETMHGYYTYLEEHPPGPLNRDGIRATETFHELSHGESFIEVLATRFTDPGLYVLDEPESALSFTGCLALVAVLRRIATSGTAQAIVATHSPVIAATPGARLLEVGDAGLTERAWADLELVQHWSAFLGDPSLYLRHLDE